MKYLLTIALLIFMAACNPSKPCGCSPVIYLMEYTPSQCNEPWHLAGAGGNTKEVIHSYLVSQKINAQNITVKLPSTEFITCAACTCSSGVVVSISVFYDDIIKLEKLGFKTKK